MPKFIDVTGEKYGRLLVLEKVKVRGKKEIYWRCKCDCGKLTQVMSQNLREGKIRSCGCLKDDIQKTLQFKHGHSRVGRDRKMSPEYNTWRGMRERCNYVKHKHYKDYGGRGICVCTAWDKSFIEFLNYVGAKPTPKHTIDRIDPDGNYEPGNVRWATRKQQQANKRCKPT